MYRRADSIVTDESEIPVIVVAQRSLASGLVIAVDPSWRLSVLAQDASEMDELLKDLAVRAKSAPDTLWKQLSSLNWGILVTGESGENILDQVPILRLLNRFDRLN